MDRIARILAQHDITGCGDRLRDVGKPFLGAEGGHDLGMMTAKTRSAEVLRNGVPASAVHATISWSAVASFLDAVLPR